MREDCGGLNAGPLDKGDDKFKHRAEPNSVTMRAVWCHSCGRSSLLTVKSHLWREREAMASTRIDAPDARRIAAVLANDDMRTLYATIVLGQDSTLPAATAKKALAALLRSGLVQQVVEEGDDSHPGDGHR